MGLDIRLPIGLMFTVLGLLLTGFGVLGNKLIYTRSLGININLAWGLVLLGFGAVMLVLGGARSRQAAQGRREPPAKTQPGKRSKAGARVRA